MGSYGTAPKALFSWLEGEQFLSAYQQNKSLTCFFCSVCGSFLAGTHGLDPGNIFISLGSLDTDDIIEIQYQQFINSKANWLSLDPTIKRHNEWPDWVYDKFAKDP